MKNATVATIISVLAVASPAATAGWSGEAGLGFLSTSGNTSTSSASAKLALDYQAEGWKNAFTASAISTSDDGDTTAERYTVGDKLDWNFSDKDYAFGAVDFEKDLFGGIRQRTSEAVGYGRRLLTGPVHELNAELGAGARQQQAQGTRERSSDGIGRLSGNYKWTISETSAFAQALKIESGEDNTYSESVSELKLSVVGNLFATLSYTLKNNSDVPAGAKKTDSFSALSLTYSFGKP